ncbi:LacI family DNA-binding transcriptional regulator [Sphingomonas sp. BIUV-7]|uniref:LacI family DNA-binding transcriptional regulator n=1 Tax=Sphingomonas natans TaxID=3063330 RepID=A0ABT8YAA3_9SPHN|nr:LacI family DNA-binding transcriptional regulator [Sphingomonas sp. BIUV-7]MDO6415250.1 LacI family DNA-binding transcriptional regulator [Sphingomonas sp. BIUV-7]
MSERLPLPKMGDVAARAGVSSATVSRFLNTPGMVAAATAERIRRAVEETGYVPDLMAGGLASSKSRLVAALVPDMAQSIFNATIEAMVDELSIDGHIVMLGLTGIDNGRMPALISAALSRRADAIILTGILSDPATRDLMRSRGVTVIETWGLPDDPIDVAVGFSHRAVGQDIAHFLRSRGYARPHLLSAAGTRAMERRQGFVDDWLASGGEQPSEQSFPSQTRFGNGRAAFRQLRELDVVPDVVVCSSDWLAQGVLVEAMAAGVKVPDEVAVVGFGNLAIAAEMRPTITTIDIDGARIGREAVNVLRRRAAGEKILDRHIDVGFRLIARESA